MSYREEIQTKEDFLRENGYNDSWFERRYWIEGTTEATLVTNLPFNFTGANIGQDYSGYIKGMGFWPSSCEILSATITFHRTIRKNDFSGHMELEYATGSKVTCPIGFAHANNKENVVSFWNPSNLYNVMDSGNGTKLTVRIKKDTDRNYGSGTLCIQFQSSESWAEDAQGHGNGSKFTIRVRYRYDPAEAYSVSNARFANYSARACDTSLIDEIRDVNKFTARILPQKYDSKVFHVVKWYTMPNRLDSPPNFVSTERFKNDFEYPISILRWFDNNGDEQIAYEDWEVPYQNNDQHLQVQYVVPQEWCWAWPNYSVGWGYFDLETWYIYSPTDAATRQYDDPMPRLLYCVGSLRQPINLVVETPDYMKPSITRASLEVYPVTLPGSSEINTVSATWVANHAYVQNYCSVKLSVDEFVGSFGSKVTDIVFEEQSYRRMRSTFHITDSTEPTDINKSMKVTGAGQLVFTAYAKDTRGKYSDPFYISIPNGIEGITIQTIPFLDEDGNVITYIDDYGDEQPKTYQALLVTQYGKPTFDVCKSYRVNEHDDISDNGKFACVEASAAHTQVIGVNDDGTSSGTDMNPIKLYWRIRMNEESSWNPQANEEYPTGMIGISGGRSRYDDMQIFPSAEYLIQFILDDAMTEYLNEVAGVVAYDANSNSVKTTEQLGSGESTIFLKRNGLGVCIGTTPKTEKNYRCLEISETWEIRHGQEDDGTVYYIPDVVFTPAGYQFPPKKRKGRIWLQEVG